MDYTTIGMMISLPGFKKPKLVKFSVEKTDGGESRKITVISGRNLGQIRAAGTKTVSFSYAEKELFDDDNVIEFRNFARFFGA